MANDDLEESLQALSALLDHGIVEFVKVDLSGQRRDSNASALTLEDIAEVFKVRITAAHAAVAQLERGDVGV